MTPEESTPQPITLSKFQQYCAIRRNGVMSLEALYESIGGREASIQKYMECGFDAPMMEWLAENGMAEIVYRRMQIEGVGQVLKLLQGIQETLAGIEATLRGMVTLPTGQTRDREK